MDRTLAHRWADSYTTQAVGHLTHIAQTHPDDAVRSLENPMTSPQLTLPPGFLVGTATAAAQIEGGATVG